LHTAAVAAVAAGPCVLPQVCNDVQMTAYETQCQMITNTKTKCDIVFSQKCDKVRSRRMPACLLVVLGSSFITHVQLGMHQ
jgi:hypothetical protein